MRVSHAGVLQLGQFPCIILGSTRVWRGPKSHLWRNEVANEARGRREAHAMSAEDLELDIKTPRGLGWIFRQA